MNTNTKNPIRCAAASLALLAALTTGAHAGDAHAGDAPQIHVKYADLNINTPAGATVLYLRIRAAADQVCGVRTTRELERIGPAKACAEHAVGIAVAAVNAPTLTQLYEVRMGAAAVTRLAAVR
jgi:UrcA family protein